MPRPEVFSSPESLTAHETEDSGLEIEPSGCQNLVLFAGRKTASKNRGQICFWRNDAADMLIDLWSRQQSRSR